MKPSLVIHICLQMPIDPSESRIDLPKSQSWLVRGFCWYTRRLIRKHFWAFACHALDAGPLSTDAKRPIVFYCNHPGWWDPIVAMQISQHYFPDRVFYAPIDQLAIEKYSVFKKLGFFGIALGNREGAATFLKQSHAVLKAPHAALWLTPEGRFADPRDKSADWMPGLSHLLKKTPHAICIPVAIEYPFVDESKPLMICKFGKALDGELLRELSKSDGSVVLKNRLRETQQALCELIVARSFNDFKVLVRTAQKPESLYDFGRWIVCKLTFRQFELRHGKSFI